MKILIIDNDALVRKSFESMLKKCGHIVSSAKDIDIANDLIVRETPDFVICDLILPVFTTLAFLQLLRNFSYFKIPVLAISSLDKTDFKLASNGLQNIHFKSRPVNLNDIPNCINKILKNKNHRKNKR